MKIRVDGKTKHGKHKIIDYGDVWVVDFETPSSYRCCDLSGNYFRWIDKQNDRDYIISEIINE